MSGKKKVDAPGLMTVLTRCYRVVSQIAERSIAATGLCLTDFAALEALRHKGPLTITEIQAKVLLASGSMTAAVDRLEQKGLVIRTSTPKDRRARVIELTPEGRRVVDDAFERHAADLEEAMSVLNAGEKQQLHELLKKLGLFAAAQGAKEGKPDYDSSSQE
jgi:MarR family 2-MHQ and catechol resistance regulon transcriptional repressor